MKSKSHAKKCEELGVSPLPTAEDMMEDSTTNGQLTVPGDSDSEDDSDCDDQSEEEDTEDMKARLPNREQEAARGLLSLSMTPPMIMTQAVDTYRSIPHTTIDRLGEDLSVKTPVRPEFAPVQKITFEFPRPEQYYSNPNMAKPTSGGAPAVDEADDSDLPMDLTKPRSVESGRKVVYSQIVANGLISSLVSMGDKMAPQSTSSGMAGVDENALLQQYLTERAMHETKMKALQQQHQQLLLQQNQKEFQLTTSTKVESTEDGHQYSSTAPVISSDVIDGERMNAEEVKVFEGHNKKELPIQQIETKQEPSGMDTLADIAANSTKLGLGESLSTDRNTTAKFVASEYLKMTTQRNREDGESSSDQEMTTTTVAAAAQAAKDKVTSESNRKRADSVSEVLPRTVVVVKDSQKNNAEFVNVTNAPQPCRIPPPADDGRSVCEVCRKSFQKPSQLKLHMNIHYLERKFRCEPCGVSFRTQGHLHKHERSVSHQNKVSMTSTFGVATTVNPRPFNCTDCRVAFRIHGHLAKHLRSKMHVLRLECLCKIPFGTYAEIERAGINLTAIDTKDCESFLASLKSLARQLPELANVVVGEGGANSKASGDESDNEDSDSHGVVSNGGGGGYVESLSGNENAADRNKSEENKNGMKRKFGTLLNINETEEEEAQDQGMGEQVMNSGAGGGGSTTVEVVVGSGNNSNDNGGKEFEAASLAPVEKRIKVN